MVVQNAVQGLLLTPPSEMEHRTNISSIMTQTIPSLPNKWNNFIITNISKKSADNKLTQFSFKLLHRTLVAKKELKRYKILPQKDNIGHSCTTRVNQVICY